MNDLVDKLSKLLMLIVRDTCDKVARDYAIEALAEIERAGRMKAKKGDK